MDRDRERFARMAERAKLPPFTPLENLLLRGKPEAWTGRARPAYWVECSCGCNADEWVSGGQDQRVIDGLAKLRERKGIVVEDATVPTPAAKRSKVLSNWDNLIWTVSTTASRTASRTNDFMDSITYAGQIVSTSDTYISNWDF